ncbi:protein of unknown function [Cyanobium sp. NIES-981]|nr:protein of unknown function [Cyanobium sp. NIES-981]
MLGFNIQNINNVKLLLLIDSIFFSKINVNFDCLVFKRIGLEGEFTTLLKSKSLRHMSISDNNIISNEPTCSDVAKTTGVLSQLNSSN